MVFLELAQAPDTPDAVMEMAKAAFRTNLHGFRNEGVGRRLVALRNLGDDMHQACDSCPLHELHEANQFSLDESADEGGPVRKGSELSLDGFDRLLEMGEAFSLAHRRFIVDCF